MMKRVCEKEKHLIVNLNFRVSIKCVSKGGNLRHVIFLFAFFALLAPFFQNCSRLSFQKTEEVERSLASTGEAVNISGGEGNNFSFVENIDERPVRLCQFISVETLRSILKDQLGIEAGDIPILNKDGSVMRDASCAADGDDSCGYIEKFETPLGLGNISGGDFDDRGCSTVKFKLVAEIFINACAIGMENEDVREEIFPLGLNNFDEVYMTFIGRKPFAHESDILKDLVKNMEYQTGVIAACATVASSLEAVTNL